MLIERLKNLNISEEKKLEYRLLIEEALNLALTPSNFKEYRNQLFNGLSAAVRLIYKDLLPEEDLSLALNADIENYIFNPLGFGPKGDHIFDQINELELKIQSILGFTTETIKSEYPVLPPGNNPTIQTGYESPFVKPKIYLKTETIIHILNKLNLDFIVYKGNVERNWVRQTPYSAIIIPDSNLAFLVCNEGNNATFAIEIPSEFSDTEKSNFLEWLMNITKEELKKYILGDKKYVVGNKNIEVKGVVIRYKSKSPWKWNEEIIQIVEEGIITDDNTEEADDETLYVEDPNIPKGEITSADKFIIINNIEYGSIASCLQRALNENPNLLLTVTADQQGLSSLNVMNQLSRLANSLMKENLFDSVDKIVYREINRTLFNYNEFKMLLEQKLHIQLKAIGEDNNPDFKFLVLSATGLPEYNPGNQVHSYFLLKDLLDLLNNSDFNRKEIRTYLLRHKLITLVPNTRSLNKTHVELIRLDTVYSILSIFNSNDELYKNNISILKQIINNIKNIGIFAHTITIQTILDLWSNIQSNHYGANLDDPLKIALKFIAKFWGFSSIEIVKETGALLFIDADGKIFVNNKQYVIAVTNGKYGIQQATLEPFNDKVMIIRFETYTGTDGEVPSIKIKAFYPKDLIDLLIAKLTAIIDQENHRALYTYNTKSFINSLSGAWDHILELIPSLFIIFGTFKTQDKDFIKEIFIFNELGDVDIDRTIDNIFSIIKNLIQTEEKGNPLLEVSQSKENDDALEIFRYGVSLMNKETGEEYFFAINLRTAISNLYPDLKGNLDKWDFSSYPGEKFLVGTPGRKGKNLIVSKTTLEYILSILALNTCKKDKSNLVKIEHGGKIYVRPGKLKQLRKLLEKNENVILRTILIRVEGSFHTRMFYDIEDINTYFPDFIIE